jgi:hypothetical protein
VLPGRSGEDQRLDVRPIRFNLCQPLTSLPASPRGSDHPEQQDRHDDPGYGPGVAS